MNPKPMTRWLLPLGLFFSFVAVPASAELQTTKPCISCQRAPFSIAMTHLWTTHPDVLQAQAALTATGFEVKAAYAGFLPYAQVDVGQQRQPTSVARFILPLLSGGSTLAAVDSARAAALQATADVDRARLRLGLRLVDAWFG